MSPPTESDLRPKPPLRILMLHGYTQSGPLFRSKTRALEKALTKALPNHTLHLSYPTGPIILNPSDIPGYNGPSTSNEDPAEPEPAYGWWRRKDLPTPNKPAEGETEIVYTGLQDGLARIAETIRQEGPFDGVIGFSQGGCAAGIVASLLETTRRSPPLPSSASPDPEAEPFPTCFASLHQPPLRFAIIYSGFIAPGARYAAFYDPPLKTPTLHFLGALDGVVEESRSRGLIAVCEDARVVTHPGGHFLPSQRPWLDAAVGFVRECLEAAGGDDGGGGSNGRGKKKEERVEDMDVPF
ncbi:MAG: hypothetical protein L6R40_005731 [Gallowayella cf. fulva]|nr:MAG: hypothetical protein L6R40_005731 [Xanthomendoza cf. fulva]